jgi:hypothetical protein
MIARNYAETLLALAQRHGGDETVDAFGAALDELARLLREEPRVRAFLESPLVGAEQKKDAIRKTLDGRAPELFVRFLLVVIDKRRAAHLGDRDGVPRHRRPAPRPRPCRRRARPRARSGDARRDRRLARPRARQGR